MALPGVFTRNWTIKVSAFGIALLLWLAVRFEAPDAQAVEGVPVRVDLVDPQWALVQDPTPAGVTVRFRGPSRELLRMMVDRPAVVIPMDEVGSPDTTVVLQRHWVRLQDRPGVTVEEIQPTTVRLALEPIHRAELPPALRFEGELAEQLALADRPSVTPAQLRAFGPESRMAGLDSVPMLPLDLTGIEATGVHIVQVDSAALAGVQVQPMQAEVEVRVADRVERLVGGIPITLELDDWEEFYEVVPEDGSILVRGARDRVDAVDATTLQLVATVEDDDLPQEPGDEVTGTLRVVGPPEFVTAEPELDEVTIRRREPAESDDPGGDVPPSAPTRGEAP